MKLWAISKKITAVSCTLLGDKYYTTVLQLLWFNWKFIFFDYIDNYYIAFISIFKKCLLLYIYVVCIHFYSVLMQHSYGYSTSWCFEPEVSCCMWQTPWRWGLHSGIHSTCNRGDWCYIWVVRFPPRYRVIALKIALVTFSFNEELRK
jgi:hypothetical protein